MLPFSFKVVFSFLFAVNILIADIFVRYYAVFNFLLKINCFRQKKET